MKSIGYQQIKQVVVFGILIGFISIIASDANNAKLKIKALFDEEIVIAQASQSNPWYTGGPDGGIIDMLLSDPTNDDIYYAASYEAGDVYKTIDGGISWFQLKTGLELVKTVSSIAIADDGLTLYLGSDYYDYSIYKSTDGGNSWIKLPIGNSYTTITYIAIDPNNNSRIYFAAYEELYVTSDLKISYTAIGARLC